MTQRRVWTLVALTCCAGAACSGPGPLPGGQPVAGFEEVASPEGKTWDGLTYVFKTGQSYEQIAANHLHDGGFATPAICAGRIYLRTLHFLYCLGNAKEGAR